MSVHLSRISVSYVFLLSFAACGVVTSASPSLGGVRGNNVPVTGDPTRQPVSAGSDGSTVEAVRGDLWGLVSAQEEYHAINRTYARSLSALRSAVDYASSQGTRIRIEGASESGYVALASRGTTECAVFVGTASPPRRYTRTNGQVACNQS